jgi:hypothetical protein
MNKSLAKDNFHKDCPAVMNYSPFTDYRSSNKREQYVKTMNGIVCNDEYRQFLQSNTEKIMESEWDYLAQNYSCRTNPCIHTLPTRPPHGSHRAELALYNAVRAGKAEAPCRKLKNYRLCK